MRRLPPEVLLWAQSQVRDEPIEAIQRLPRARTSEVIGFRAGDRALVLRWYPERGFLDQHPDAIEREVAALSALEGTSLPAPVVLAASGADPSAVLMTRVPGRFELGLPDPGAVREVIDRIHAVDPALVAPWTYRGYHEGQALRRPTWWRDPAVWDRAIERTETARPTGPGVFLHRDLNPGNLLWTGAEVSGVVDWVNACLGPAGVDVGHLRINLALLDGAAAADAFDPGDPAWDIEMALGMLEWRSVDALDRWTGPWPDVAVAAARARLEAFMAAALSRLG